MKRFNDSLLSDFIHGFWGYGNPEGDYWYVGMEEGGGDSFGEIKARITQWDKRGREPFEDLCQYHQDIGVTKWFRDRAPLQPTWNRIIRVMLAAKGEEPDREVVRSYQIDRLGRSDGETCLLELMPLPSPSTSDWL